MNENIKCRIIWDPPTNLKTNCNIIKIQQISNVEIKGV